MGLIDKLKQLKDKRRSERDESRPRGRRQDPEYTNLPGGASIKEAEQAPSGRAGELAD